MVNGGGRDGGSDRCNVPCQSLFIIALLEVETFKLTSLW